MVLDVCILRGVAYLLSNISYLVGEYLCELLGVTFDIVWLLASVLNWYFCV